MTAVEQLVQELKKLGVLKIDDLHWTEQDDVNNAIKQAQAMEKEQKIEFACKVVEVSSEKYIQGKTTEQIAEELIKQQ